jgi:hypothetical protein
MMHCRVVITRDSTFNDRVRHWRQRGRKVEPSFETRLGVSCLPTTCKSWVDGWKMGSKRSTVHVDIEVWTGGRPQIRLSACPHVHKRTKCVFSQKHAFVLQFIAHFVPHSIRSAQTPHHVTRRCSCISQHIAYSEGAFWLRSFKRAPYLTKNSCSPREIQHHASSLLACSSSIAL